jgi:hypothetical protein
MDQVVAAPAEARRRTSLIVTAVLAAVLVGVLILFARADMVLLLVIVLDMGEALQLSSGPAFRL